MAAGERGEDAGDEDGNVKGFESFSGDSSDDEFFADVPGDAGASSERKFGVDVESGVTLRRALGRIDGMALIISSIIGSGIFAAPGVLLSNIGGDASLAMIIWTFGAVLAACQGFVFAELGTLMPSAGGEYSYMRAAFGDNIAFTLSFSRFWVLLAGSRGILAFTFARYLYGAIFPNDTASSDSVWLKKVIAMAGIWFVTIMNCFKIKWAARVAKSFVSLKLVLVALLAIFMIIQLSRTTAVFAENFSQPFARADFKNLGPALIAAMWAYGGSGIVVYVGEEMKDPIKDTAPAIIYSLLVVLVAYVSCNLGYFSALTSDQIMETSVVATDTARVVVGTAGSLVVSLFISISVLGTLFNGILAAGRFAYATARDGQFPAILARLSKTQRTPYVALITHGVMCTLFLAVPGSSINSLLSFTAPVNQVFELLLVGALVKIRRAKRKEGGSDHAAAFRMPLYPVPLVVVVAAAIYMIVNSLIDKPLPTVLGIVITFLAIPLHYFFIRPRLRKRRAEIALTEIKKSDAVSSIDDVDAKMGAGATDWDVDEPTGSDAAANKDESVPPRGDLAREPAAEVKTDVEY